MTVNPLPVSADPAWVPAEEVATRHRTFRLRLRARYAQRDRIFGPILIITWLAATVTALTRFQTLAGRGRDSEFISFGALVLFAVAGIWWAVATGRYLVRSPASIQAALPPTARKTVRRQLVLREPLDSQHAAV